MKMHHGELVDDFDFRAVKQWSKDLGFTSSDGKEPRTIIMKSTGISPGVQCKDGFVIISSGLTVEDNTVFQKPDKLLHLLTGRSAYVFVPPENPRDILIYQRIRIASADDAAFNRFADAVQEVINATILTARVINGAKFSVVPGAPGMYQ